MPSRPILLAEDDAADAFMIQRYYERSGVRNPLHVFPHGEAVVNYFEGSRVHYPLPVLLLLSLKMPLLDGWEVLEYMRRTSQTGFPIVVLTGSTDLRLIRQAMQLGAESVLMKPLEREEFCELLKRVPGIEMKGCDEEGTDRGET